MLWPALKMGGSFEEMSGSSPLVQPPGRGPFAPDLPGLAGRCFMLCKLSAHFAALTGLPASHFHGRGIGGHPDPLTWEARHAAGRSMAAYCGVGKEDPIRSC